MVWYADYYPINEKNIDGDPRQILLTTEIDHEPVNIARVSFIIRILPPEYSFIPI